MDRSNLPVTMGIIAPSASIAGIDWLDRTAEMLSRVGNVSGRVRENAANSSAVSARRP